MFNITETFKDKFPNLILLITEYIKSVMDNSSVLPKKLFLCYARSGFKLLYKKERSGIKIV